MAVPYVYFKTPTTDIAVIADVTSMLIGAETITSIVVGTASPVTSTPLSATVTTGTSSVIGLTITGGNDGLSYGFQLTITTNARVFIVTVATSVSQAEFIPYTTENPDAFQDLVDEIEAGKAAVGTSVFAFPPQIDPSGGFVTWEFLASDGTVYAAGNAFDYTVQSNGLANTVVAKSIITVPVTVPPSLDGQAYQLRYTLSLSQEYGTPPDPTAGNLGQNVFFQFENVRVVGLNTVPLGTQPSVELQGVPATVSIVLDTLYDNVTVELWAGPTQVVAPTQIQAYERTANGWYFAGVLDTSGLGVSLVPYQIIWKYWASTNTGIINQENADFFVVNPSIMSAVNDVKAKINKARTTLYGTPDMLFPASTILTWLRRGGDAFNIAYGQFTNFTFTNALGGIREFWLLCSEAAALASAYLSEAEKSFNFQGAAISLDVDRTQYLEAAATAIQTRLDNELKLIKTNLIIKGNTSGDGSVNAGQLQHGAIGAVGITITQASMWGAYAPGYFGNRGI